MKNTIRQTGPDDTSCVPNVRRMERLLGDQVKGSDLFDGAIKATENSLNEFLDSAMGESARFLLRATGRGIVIARGPLSLRDGRLGRQLYVLSAGGYVMTREIIVEEGQLGPSQPLGPISTGDLARILYDPRTEPALPTVHMSHSLPRIRLWLTALTERLAESVAMHTMV